MPERLSQTQNLFPHIPAFLFVFLVVVVGLIALMCVYIILRILWSIIRLIFGRRRRRYSIDNSGDNPVRRHHSSLRLSARGERVYNSGDNPVRRHNMGNPMYPNSPLNLNNPMNPNSPNNPNGWTNMNSPNNPNGWTNMNSPNNPFGWRHPTSPNNPHNRMHKPMHTPTHRSMHKK